MRASAFFARIGTGGLFTVLPWLIVSVLAIACVAFTVGASFGSERATARAQAERAQALAEAHRRYDAQLVDGQARVADLQTTLREQRGFYSRLSERLTRAQRSSPPLVARVAPAASSAAPAVAAAPPRIEPGPVLLELGVSHLGVSLWNSALLGADVASGACGPDGAPASACAALAGVSFEDAWANHATNAARCAEDRARHAALIGYVNALHARFNSPR